ncbi:MAG TPA: type 2 lanthipeptide synthetase LanM family protein [Rhizomicrobium sp.]|nr:type 2 lanthipeptide synthetase LanM family protein [Rhizomicrobium sp.]
MASNADSRFDAALGCLFSAAAEGLAAQLAATAGLTPRAADAILAATREALLHNLNRRLTRLLLLELNAARVEGRLKAATPEARWDEFVAQASTPAFWDGMDAHYPTMRARIERLVANLCASSLLFAQRWAADRHALATICGGRDPGDLVAVSFGAGDTHRGGKTVAIVACERARIVYKPRSVAPEARLAEFLSGLDRKLHARLPKVVEREDHGWAEFVEHRYAKDDEELRRFYEGIGHWLAIMRLLGGTDFHAENLIACGDTPVIVDAETLFAPNPAPLPQGLGDATDRAVAIVAGTVLATGLLPTRSAALGFRGVDVSGAGAIKGEQPSLMLPGVLDDGSDTARLGLAPVQLTPQQNHPADQPDLLAFWPEVVKGFRDLCFAFRRFDAGGALVPMLERFKDCRIRVIVRPTTVYDEIGRMLWHPVSLHNEARALGQARELLAKMAENVAGSPSDRLVIEAEVGDLLIGDIPYFSTVARSGALEGPNGTAWLDRSDLVDAALQSWRDADIALESAYVRNTLVSAYSDADWQNLGDAMAVITTRRDDLDRRRRAQAAVAMRKIVDTAIRGRDGTVTWIAPTLSADGLAVRVLGNDVYSGLSGITMAAAAYLKEQRAGRADAVEGVEELLDGMRATLRAGEAKRRRVKRDGLRTMPPAIGVYFGLGSQIWRHLALTDWGLEDADDADSVASYAREMSEAAAYDELFDMLTGRAGAIPPLLALAERTQAREFLDIARVMGDGLCDRAARNNGYAFWTHERWPQGLGGFAHGATGIGWSLFKLAEASGGARYHDTARAAFAFEDSLYDPDARNWRDLRNLGGPETGCAWCHGAVGIALARLDLDPTLAKPETRAMLRGAAETAWQFGLGCSHCACHGSIGIWELLDKAAAHGEGPKDVSREAMLSAVVSALEDSGPSYGVLKDAYVPGLLLGMSGVVYQMLRADPKSALPSFLVPSP